MGRKPKQDGLSLKKEQNLNNETTEREQMQNEQTLDKPVSDSAVKEIERLTIDPHNVRHAYSLIENEGKYHVISVEFDPNKLVPGKVKKVESHTEKFIMQERLQVLLMGDDLI